MPSGKIDLYKLHKSEYAAPNRPTLVQISPAKYLTIDGKGEPGGAAFQTKIGALYNVAFTIKMDSKFAGTDYSVCKLEGLWWSKRRGADFFDQPRGEWNWKLIIRTPEFIGDKSLRETIEKLLAKGKDPVVGEVRLETIDEGRCIQVLHIGPYSKETETVTRMKEFAKANRLVFNGLHHEIYLSDPRRVSEQRLRTILRYPVR